MNTQDIETLLNDTFSPSQIHVIDESDQHAGHRGTQHKHNTHFHIIIVSSAFEGMSKIKRHREIYSVLKPAFENTLHALRISAKTPDE